MSERYRFGPFELDAKDRVLLKDGQVTPLQDLPLRLLLILAKSAPELVTREQLRESLWSPGTHLDVDASLNTAIARVREALEDRADSPTYVATIPRRGYRFVAPLESKTIARSTSWPILVGMGLVLIAMGLGLGIRRAPSWFVDSSNSDSALDGVRSSERELIQIGWHQANRRSKVGLEKAIASFQTAAALNPESAAAYSGLAVSYALLGIYDYWRPREAFRPAETMANRALELDSKSAEAHLSRSIVAAVRYWDWTAASAGMEAMIRLDPQSADLWLWRGSYLSALGRHQEALKSTRTALSLDPTSPVINAALVWHLFQARQDEEAVDQARRALELDPDYFDTWDNLKWIELTRGRSRSAVDAWVRAEELSGGDGEAIRRNYRENGLESLHRSSIESQVKRWDSGAYQSPFDIAIEFAALKEVDDALVWLERSFGEKETDLISLQVDSRLDPLRQDPRFLLLLQSMDFPQIEEP